MFNIELEKNGNQWVNELVEYMKSKTTGIKSAVSYHETNFFNILIHFELVNKNEINVEPRDILAPRNTTSNLSVFLQDWWLCFSEDLEQEIKPVFYLRHDTKSNKLIKISLKQVIFPKNQAYADEMNKIINQ